MPLPYRASTDPTDNEVRSVAKLDWHEQADGALTHIQLPFSETRNAGDTIKVSALISGHFTQGGMGVHLSVGDVALRERAINDPDKHLHLLVRMGGYSARFLLLSPDMQRDILNCMQHTL